MPRGVKTSRSLNKQQQKSRELQFRDDDQRYGIVTKLLGHNRVMVNVLDLTDSIREHECLCTVRGSMRRREWVHVDDIVLVALRDFGKQHDIVARYTDDEVKTLTRVGEVVLPKQQDDQSMQHDIVFEDVDAI